MNQTSHHFSPKSWQNADYSVYSKKLKEKPPENDKYSVEFPMESWYNVSGSF